MLDGSPTLGDATAIGDVENNEPKAFIFGTDRMNGGSKTKEALLKRGGWKLRTAAPLHHHKPPRNCSSVPLSDNHHNSSATTGSSPPETRLPVGSHIPHHVKQQGPKKELLKPKSGRLERGNVQSGAQPSRSLSKHDQTVHHTSGHTHKPKQSQTPTASPCAKKNDARHPKRSPSSQQPQSRELKKPLHTPSNVKTLNPPVEAPSENLKDGEKIYAGAKFSEPPSPSVLPKPPSHWFGKKEPQQSNQSQEQMTVHLKSLLKVQD